ncbi:2-acyl-glycerophospho-ethanolamine acyltransferase [Variovorax sp. PBS-H4]|uniref:lysophospholipid acyltransferase family protein n=1 Tax=Variovorax sp. PBS-H4 TaxID=434008 RepID=UPI001317FC5B|nr:lysophospholipid acyltransferase family protein [Variovorax sp. PBS-H4]VTU40544.1 2-acyl-glycerophospho-ethanolamine acyltransferase [Variovorax sp. PBS-H4]
MRSLSAFVKLMRALAHAHAGWWTIRAEFPRLSHAEREQRVQAWAARMLAIMGVRLVVQGTPPQKGPLLVVSNHVSWLDILTIHAARHVRFVSKANVQHWPLIGTLANGAGTLYIERERRRDALRVVHSMTEALSRGDVIAVFPEGTTGDGNTVLPFHANLLQAAISAGAPVQPMALRFADAATGETSMAPRYIGDDNLAASLWKVLKSPPLLSIVRFGEPQASWGRDRRGWALSLHADVQALRRETH